MKDGIPRETTNSHDWEVWEMIMGFFLLLTCISILICGVASAIYIYESYKR